MTETCSTYPFSLFATSLLGLTFLFGTNRLVLQLAQEAAIVVLILRVLVLVLRTGAGTGSSGSRAPGRRNGSCRLFLRFRFVEFTARRSGTGRRKWAGYALWCPNIVFSSVLIVIVRVDPDAPWWSGFGIDLKE